MSTEYVTVYRIARIAPDWWFACVGLLPLTAGVVIQWGKRRFKWSRPNWLLAVFLLSFGILWLGAAGLSTLLPDFEAYAAYQKGDYKVVKGVVTDFRPMPYEGHQDECFSVQDQQFCYSDYVIAPGFHNAASHGGPIRAGLPVRIAYRDGYILRLDVAKGQAPTAAKSAAVSKEAERQWQERTSNDPLERRMTTAFLFTGVCWTLWWNLQWRRVMRFWLKPPYRRWTQIGFRVFFVLSFLGVVSQFVRQLFSHPLSKQEIPPTLWIAAIMCVVVGVMSASGLWVAERRDAKVGLRA